MSLCVCVCVCVCVQVGRSFSRVSVCLKVSVLRSQRNLAGLDRILPGFTAFFFLGSRRELGQQQGQVRHW